MTHVTLTGSPYEHAAAAGCSTGTSSSVQFLTEERNKEGRKKERTEGRKKDIREWTERKKMKKKMMRGKSETNMRGNR